MDRTHSKFKEVYSWMVKVWYLCFHLTHGQIDKTAVIDEMLKTQHQKGGEVVSWAGWLLSEACTILFGHQQSDLI